MNNNVIHPRPLIWLKSQMYDVIVSNHVSQKTKFILKQHTWDTAHVASVSVVQMQIHMVVGRVD